MQTLVIIIMMLVVLGFILKLSFHNAAGILILGVLVALAVGMSRGAAIEQSKTQMAMWIEDPSIMLNIAVLLTVDVAMAMGFCMFQVRNGFGEDLSRANRIIYLVLKWVPGLLIFPTMFAVLVFAVFNFTGADFTVTAWGLAALSAVLFVGLAYGMKLLLPERELRSELMFLVNALIAVLGVVATVNGRTAVSGVSEVEWIALAGVLVLFVAGAAAGFVIYRIKARRRDRLGY